MNVLSCSLVYIRMWTEVSFVLSQSTRLTDGRTDISLMHGYTVRCIACSRTVKLTCLDGNCSAERMMFP